MYKVFVNNKPLTFGPSKIEADRNIPFINSSDFEVAIDLLNHSANSVHIYSNNIDKVWNEFQENFKRIHAAGGVVINDKNEMLWIYRLNKWDLPKGKMEEGEVEETTAVREVEEECGISNLTITKKVKDSYHIYYHKEYILKITHWFGISYSGNEELIPQIEEGITDVKWFNIKDLHIPTENTYGNISDLIAEFLD